MNKIKLAITGCLGRMGQQIIKSSKLDKKFKLVTLTENRKVNRKISGIKPELNDENAFRKANVIIDFTVPKSTFQVLKIASKLKKKSCDRHNWIYYERGEINKKVCKKNSNFKSRKYEFRNKSFNVSY